MRSFKHALCFILGLAVSAKAIAVPVASRSIGLTIDGLPINGSSGPVSTPPAAGNANTLPTRSTSNDHLTNAKRLALGLPPLPPTRRSKARRSTPSSSPPTTVTGLIQIRATDNTVLGYVNENTANNNHFGLSVDPTFATSVSFTVDPTVTVSSQLDITAATSYEASWPLMGGIDGVVNTSDDLGIGSPNFAYIQGTTQTPANSPPASVSNSYPSPEDAESAIWSYDSTTRAITAQWVNTDGSLPPTYIEFVSGSNALVIVGDTTTFEQSFATSQPVTFTLIAANLAQPV